MKKNRVIPFGYSVSNGSYVVNTEEAEAIKRIFERYINGKSLNEIAGEMTIPYHITKQKWNKNMVKRVLENRKYLGESGFPQIIMRDEFDRAERIKMERGNHITYKDKSTAKTEEKAPEQFEIQYQPSVTVIRLTNEINQNLNTRDCDKETVRALILQCAAEKYQCIKYVKKDN